VTRINGLEGAANVRFSSVPPTEVGPRASQAEVRASSVSLSSGARALAEAAAQRLPSEVGKHVFDLLTADDRRMLTWTSDLARTHGFAEDDLSKLVVDLIAYRDQQLTLGDMGSLSSALKLAAERGARELSSVELAQAGVPAAPLALLSFSARDETLARTILSSFALRDTMIDHSFVRALLDPDRHGTHAVDFAFLRRVVVALSPAHSDGAVDIDMSFARRDAREQLAAALSSLGLHAAELGPYLAEAAEHGPALLHERIAKVLFGPASGRPAQAVLATLTRNDRALLGLLYVAARARGVSVGLVDDVARALVALRDAARPPAARAASVASEARARTLLPPLATDSMFPASSAPGASLAPRASGVPGSQAGPRVSEPTSASTAHELSRNERAGDVPPYDDALAQAAPARRFGSAAQIAARLVGSYRSLAPVGGPSIAAQALLRPLNLAEALGLSGLISELNLRALRRRRLRRRRWRGASKTLRARRRGPQFPLQLDRLRHY